MRWFPVFHAGTRISGNDVVTDGGRVISVTSSGTSMEEALVTSYHNTSLIEYEGKYYRRDIGYDLK
ncbi:MAG: hypothetical protein MZV63_34140 [Marinilabiliales bacterium]|nr:hypothetical protein [Marinilabiliales bacterium]